LGRKIESKDIAFAGYTFAGIPVFAEKPFMEKVEKIITIFRKHGYRHIKYNGEHIVGYKGKSKIMDGRYEVMYFFGTGSLILTDWKTLDERRRSRVPISRINSTLTQMEKSLMKKR